MNFFDNIPNFQPPHQEIHNEMINNNITYKIQELENRIKRLEQRIILIETEKSNNNYVEPDTSLYMI